MSSDLSLRPFYHKRPVVPPWLGPSWQWREGWQDRVGCALTKATVGFVGATACHFYLLKRGTHT